MTDSSPLLLLHLPVRNGARTLPRYLERAARFADGIVALDDGSDDGSAELLERDPLVLRLLRNAPRKDGERWDDHRNRSAILAASASLRPRWILSLDADELLPDDDALVLRAFLESGAARDESAYGLTVHRMIGGLEHYDKAAMWVYRLFHWRPDAAYEAARLHFHPVPTAIPLASYVDTTLRILHLASLTPELRKQRYEKYRVADPERRWQRSYEHLLDEPGELKRVAARAPELPVVLARTPWIATQPVRST